MSLTYQDLRKAMSGDLTGKTFQYLLDDMNTDKDTLYHLIGIGFKCGGIEGYQIDGVMHYRLRPLLKDITKKKWKGKYARG